MARWSCVPLRVVAPDQVVQEVSTCVVDDKVCPCENTIEGNGGARNPSKQLVSHGSKFSGIVSQDERVRSEHLNFRYES